MMATTRYLYVIAGSEDGPCKVGITRNLKARLAALQTASPYRLKVFEVWSAPASPIDYMEYLAHFSLGDKRMEGEWFNFPPRDAIKRINLVLTIEFGFGGVPGAAIDTQYGSLQNGWLTLAELGVARPSPLRTFHRDG